jgi:hypothetical protein
MAYGDYTGNPCIITQVVIDDNFEVKPCYQYIKISWARAMLSWSNSTTNRVNDTMYAIPPLSTGNTAESSKNEFTRRTTNIKRLPHEMLFDPNKWRG